MSIIIIIIIITIIIIIIIIIINVSAKSHTMGITVNINIHNYVLYNSVLSILFTEHYCLRVYNILAKLVIINCHVLLKILPTNIKFITHF